VSQNCLIITNIQPVDTANVKRSGVKHWLLLSDCSDILIFKRDFRKIHKSYEISCSLRRNRQRRMVMLSLTVAFWNFGNLLKTRHGPPDSLIGMCKMRRFLAVLRTFFHSSILYILPCHTSTLTIIPSSLTSSCHIFLRLPLKLVVPKFIYNSLL